ncbi:phage tail protein [Halopseudomonas xiamenensis]|uniref:phage tail protein n=1 Tax=Halopseudomonas xiamenensis TaxID=157792 RepID=UPI00162343A9|nr:tail fiber protein [Halopseudomonas xiamenensis]
MEPFLGEIKMVGFNFAPRGYAMCQGQLMSISQNTALFSLLGTTYGGNGQTTFALPDYRGRGPVGMGQGPGLGMISQGEMAGTESVTLTTSQLPPHAPTATASIAIPAVTTSTNVAAAPANNTHLGPIAAGGRPGTLYSTDAADTTLAPFNASVTVSPVGGGLPVGLRNPYLGTNFIIATQGIFPSRD